MPVITCCRQCAKKLELHYIMVDRERMGEARCPMCFQFRPLLRFEITPRKRRFARRSGGGERKRAGGDRV